MSIKVLLADDHKIMSHGLCEAVNSEAGMKVVGMAENGIEVVEMAGRLQPDIVIMDISMPQLNGIDATRKILKAYPQIKVIGLSMHSGSRLINELFTAGAKGYVLKDCEYSELIDAVKIVLGGQIYITPALGDTTLKAIRGGIDSDGELAFELLSERERQVVRLFTEGKSTKQVGDILSISPKTVEGHRSKIFIKLNIDNIADLTRYAIREGITSSDVGAGS